MRKLTVVEDTTITILRDKFWREGEEGKIFKLISKRKSYIWIEDRIGRIILIQIDFKDNNAQNYASRFRMKIVRR